MFIQETILSVTAGFLVLAHLMYVYSTYSSAVLLAKAECYLQEEITKELQVPRRSLLTILLSSVVLGEQKNGTHKSFRALKV